ncbi:MAG: hypothetical protein VB876_10975 [Pirellulales bacterium]
MAEMSWEYVKNYRPIRWSAATTAAYGCHKKRLKDLDACREWTVANQDASKPDGETWPDGVRDAYKGKFDGQFAGGDGNIPQLLLVELFALKIAIVEGFGERPPLPSADDEWPESIDFLIDDDCDSSAELRAHYASKDSSEGWPDAV